MKPGLPTADSSRQSAPVAPAAEARLGQLTDLLAHVEEIQPVAVADEGRHVEQRLVRARLGIASALFAALRAKHAPSASHSLRVALGCSAWALERSFNDRQRDELEIAALLHDVGKIGVPDSVLTKPARLTPEDAALMDRHRISGIKILKNFVADSSALEIVAYAPAWYDGERPGFDRVGEELPLASRMIAIVDAFDSMTTDHVYRRALSRERAINELLDCAGGQFDPKLVEEFASLQIAGMGRSVEKVTTRWLKQLSAHESNQLWGLMASRSTPPQFEEGSLFHRDLVDNMSDGVVFVDTAMSIQYWNRGAERLTGIAAVAAKERTWAPDLVDMCDDRNRRITDEECPARLALKTRSQLFRRVSISGRKDDFLSVDLHITPVTGSDGIIRGVALLLHDATPETSLEERVESLHVQATSDPLTQVANRGEFERVFPAMLEEHAQRGAPCSLIICDIDHFKKINDTHGHQAGDEALITFAALLKGNCRRGDLVARYGGEEFVMLCSDCDNNTATERAEQIRRQLSETPHACLDGKSITASFGVTELQAGDTAEAMLRRADRGLMQAKDMGRNTVVQLGAGASNPETAPRSRKWWSWFTSSPADVLLERTLATKAPLNVTVEKLRGFVADHNAQIVSLEEDHLVMTLEGQRSVLQRRQGDRPVPYAIDLRFAAPPQDEAGRVNGMLVHVVIRPIRGRDRRRRDAIERARETLMSIKSYLMAQETSSSEMEQGHGGVLETAKDILAPLIRKE